MHALRLTAGRFWSIETNLVSDIPSGERRIARLLELWLVLIVLAVTTVYGGRNYLDQIDYAAFYQQSFSPAISLACDGVLRPFQPTESQARFLNRETDVLVDCRDVSESTTLTWTSFDDSMVYLYVLTALVWKLLGIAWSNLFPIAGLLAAGFGLACYALLRVFSTSRVLSATLAIAIVIDTPAVTYIPHLRDYSKAAFIVAALALLAAGTVRPLSIRLTAALSLAAGAIVGTGLGFRSDLDIILPIAALAPFVLLGAIPIWDWLRRATAIWLGVGAGYILLVGFRWAITPVHASEQSFIAHVFVLGFAEIFYSALGFSEKSYSILSSYIDLYVFMVANLFSNGSGQATIIWGSQEYGSVNSNMLLHIFLSYPHDIMMRFLYATNRIGEFSILAVIWSPLMLTAMFIMICAHKLRPLMFVMLSSSILIAVLTLQFHTRHAFYMGILGGVLILMAVEALIWIVSQLGSGRLCRSLLAGAGTLAALGGVSAAVVATTSGFARSVQVQALETALANYEALEWVPIKFDATDTGVAPIGTIALESGPLNFENPFPKQSTILDSTQVHFSRLTLRVESNGRDEDFLVTSDFDWNALQGDSFARTPEGGFEISTKKQGYVVGSQSMSARELLEALPADADGYATLRVTNESGSGNLHVGVLDEAKQRWLFNVPLDSNRLTTEIAFRLDEEIGDLRIIFSNHRPKTNSHISNVGIFMSGNNDCNSSYINSKKLFNYYGEDLLEPTVRIPQADGNVEYYFPLMYNRSVEFKELSLGALHPSCVDEWAVASRFPPGLLPVELVTVNGELDTTPRGSWRDVWLNFLY